MYFSEQMELNGYDNDEINLLRYNVKEPFESIGM